MPTYADEYAEGIAYLQETGLDLYIPNPIGGMVFKPGSYFEDVEKENVPKPAKIGQGRLSIVFMDRFNISTTVDLSRMVRAVSIILTSFTGPREQDSPRNHQARLKEFIHADLDKCKREVFSAFLGIEKVLGLGDVISHRDYTEAAIAICAYAGALKT